ncbi:MAG: TIGR04076 family protein [Oscillibacter sp.]|jgi:uncharacterized repeat protein (TIGR04076 family)|nr:TIGR04076 family protein [Oscillibacter sp.]
MSKQVKITVLKRLLMEDLIAQYAPGPVEKCGKMPEGATYITDGRTCPEGFCPWAWADVFKDVLLVRQDATCYTKDRKGMVTACTDGLRPVIFLIEPYDP